MKNPESEENRIERHLRGFLRVTLLGPSIQKDHAGFVEFRGNTIQATQRRHQGRGVAGDADSWRRQGRR